VQSGEVLTHSGDLVLNKIPSHLTEGGMFLPMTRSQLHAERCKPRPELAGNLQEPARDLRRSWVESLVLPPFQPPDEPGKALEVIGRNAVDLLSQPIELHFGVPADIGGQTQLPQTPLHLLGRAALELRAIGAGAASKAAEAHPKIVQRLGMLRICQRGLGPLNLIEVA
jgi:hypothetical protein